MNFFPKKAYFIGIGGIGVSALAQYYLSQGTKVSGSDLVRSEMTDLLKRKGAKVFVGRNSARNLPKNIDLVVFSPAVEKVNPELKRAKNLEAASRKLQVLSYPEALGELTKKYFTVAVSGSHGKSTTTAMLAQILIRAGLSPTVIVGTKLKEFGNTNFRKGESKYLIIEADEWRASFLNYWPKIIIITNIEEEHLDYYRNLDHIIKTFGEYVGHLPKAGFLVANGEDRNISKIISNFQLPTSNQFSIKQFSNKQPEFKQLKKILKVPGEHNVSNALAALAAARILKIPDKTTFGALGKFKGTWRRFEIEERRIGGEKVTVINDYGHHPTEAKETLKAARDKFPKKKIWCVFQPHQYQRTYYLFDYFVKVFREAPVDRMIITDIYSVAGRENHKIRKKVNSKKLVEAINKKSVTYLPKGKIKETLRKKLKGGEVVLIMGAGDIYQIGKKI